MDPNANLREQEVLIARASGTRDDRVRLRELRGALKGWLMGGGFHPLWHTCPMAAAFYTQLRRYLDDK